MKKIIAAVLLSLPLALGSSARAKDNCSEDRQKFCADVKPGGGRIIQCLREHESDLSEECKESLGKVKAKVDEFKQACGRDISSVCGDVKPGGGRVIRCLNENLDKLSDGCRDAINRAKEKRGRWRRKADRFREACGDDLKNICGDVKPGQGRLMRCLKDNEGKLSKGCQEAMSGKSGGDAQAAPQSDQGKSDDAGDSDQDSD